MSEKLEKTNKKRKFYQKKRVMIPFVIALALIFLGVFGAFHSSLYQSTTNAYVDEYLIQITPKISSKIMELNVENNASVKKGEIIAELDGSEYVERIKELEVKFEQIQKELKENEFEINKTSVKTALVKEEIKDAKIDLENANSDYVRYKNEFKDGTVTKKDLENAIKNLEVAQEQYQTAKEHLKNSNNDLRIAISKKDDQMDQAREILESLQEAKLELTNATIVAPKNGKIINLNSKTGDIATSEKPLFSIVPDECYIIANFKKLPNSEIKTGQKAVVKIYSATLKKLNGQIYEILPQKGNNIPVKIKITDSIEKCGIKTGAKAYVKVRVN